MIVSGVKHACATCIRGHRSSSCTHADRQLYEIRKKGRPVSQCPHCRDLRKIKSCHTRCECGMTPSEQSKTSSCRCHRGEPCSCAGPVQIYQYIPPEASSGSSTASTNSDGLKTPNSNVGSMLHTFQSSAQQSSNLSSASQIRHKSADPYPSVQFLQTKNLERSQNAISSPLNDAYYTQTFPEIPDAPVYTVPLAIQSASQTQFECQDTWIQHQSLNPIQPVQTFQPARSDSPATSKTTRSIGTNTDPLPPGIWPEDLSITPAFMQPMLSGTIGHATTEGNNIVTSQCCPKAKDMPLEDLAPAQYNLTDSTTPIPIFSAFYAPNNQSIPQPGDTAAESNLMSIDHYEDDFDPEYFESIFDVPGCSLPGVQCRCGEDCSCAGCQTHKDNTDKVTFKDFERMDFSSDEKVRLHPATCCDTRSSHVHDAEAVVPAQSSEGGCCSHKKE